MAWEKGHQILHKKFENVNQEILDTEGFIEEEKAKVLLYKFLRENPSFTSELISGISLFPFQHMAIKAMMETDYFLGIWSRGLSKCSARDSLIHTDKGLVEIIDVNIGDSVQSANGLNKVVDKTINLAEKTHIIKTRSGFVSEGLDYHRVMVLTSDLDLTWKYSKDVAVGDYIVIKRGSDFNIPEQDIFEKFIYSQHFNAKTSHFKNASMDSWYYFFGLLIGDGHINKNGRVVSITSNDYEVVEFLRQFSNEIGLGSRIVEKGNDTKEVLINSVELQEFLKFIGFEKVNAHLKTVPSKLTHNSPEAIRALLQGLFDTDGYCSVQKRKNKGTSVKIGFTSSSEKLIKQVQNLLLCQGIVTKKFITFKGGKSKFPNGKTHECKKAWSLIACNQKELRIFADKINFRIKRKANLLLELSNQIVQNESFCDYVPYVGDKLEDFFNRKSIVANFRSKYKLNFRKNSSRRLLAEILNTKRLSKDLEDKIIPLMRPDFIFEEVAETNIGECVTVDIQVENESCYVADGIINHNSFTTGIFAAMDAILNQGVYIGIISKSFRQSRMIFNKIEEIAKSPKAAYLSQCITRVSKSNDQWVMEIGRSKIIALPLGDGEKLRGFRFQRMIIDELLLMPEKIINEVILPFLAVVENPTERQKIYDLETKMIEAGKMTEEDRHRWSHNKIIGLSSASYKFEYLYKLYQQYENLILNPSNKDNAHRVIMHLSYDCAPKQLYDQNLLDQSKATMSEAQFEREFGSIFTDDSSGYFKVSKMAACTVPDGEGQSVEVVGDKNSEYILSFDPSWSESEGSDDFAMHVIKLNADKRFGTIVHSYALAGANLKKHIVYFHYLYTHFNIRMIVGDYNGGVQFINSCNESEIFKKAGIQIQCIDSDFDDPQNYNADLRSARNQYNVESKKICILRKPSSSWIRSANEMLQAAFDHKKIWFAGTALDDDYSRQKSAVIPIDEIAFSRYNDEGDSYAKQIDLIEHLKDTIDATKVQCALIQVSTTANGSQSFDLPYNLKKQRNADKARKDSYSALVLGNWLMNIYFDMMATPEAAAQTTFIPMFVD